MWRPWSHGRIGRGFGDCVLQLPGLERGGVRGRRGGAAAEEPAPVLDPGNRHRYRALPWVDAVFVLGRQGLCWQARSTWAASQPWCWAGPPPGQAGFGLIAFVIAICVSSLVMAGPQVAARMAADGFLPRGAGGAAGPAPASRTPGADNDRHRGFVDGAFASLLTYVGFTLVWFSRPLWRPGVAATQARPGPEGSGWPWVPALFLAFVLGSTAFTVAERPRESLVGLATLAVGLLAYWLQNGSRFQGGPWRSSNDAYVEIRPPHPPSRVRRAVPRNRGCELFAGIPNGATMAHMFARLHAVLSCPLLGLLGGCAVDTRRR